jgi:SAM-dependent methyltransferase
MRDSFEKLKTTWQTLGREDPLWAIVSVDGKRGGKWDLQEFLALGERDVREFHALLQRQTGAPDRLNRVLDFGCGVGRLSRAWGNRANSVVGVDISKPMVERGNELLADMNNVRLQVNEADDLSSFKSDTFDLVFSHACLQHMPWKLASGYIREFGRVCAPGGWVMLSLPTRVLCSTWPARVRQKMVDMLPFGLGGTYRRWRHGSAAVFDMYYTPSDTVKATLREAGLTFLHLESDASAGEHAEGFFYLAAKPGESG